MFLILSLMVLVQSEDIKNLRDKNPIIRKNSISTLAEKDSKEAIRPIIDVLGSERDESVLNAAADALERLTGVRGNGSDFSKWQKWYQEVGRNMVRTSSVSDAEIKQQFDLKIKEVDDKTREAKNEIRILSITVAIIATAFVLVMIYFVGHVSSKLKEWKELVRQAGVYIEESQQITKRPDRVLEELEAKKLDILEFVKKLKEEKENEIERFGDLLQQNTDHKLREEVMELRQKAEKELEETVGQLRQQIEIDVRRLGGDQKEKLDKDFKTQNDRFMREVEAHILFLQANFAHSHGKPEEALKIYRKLTSLKPDHQVGWEKMGTAYRELMRYDEALEAYQKAIELDPEDPSSYYNMAATYARMRKRDKMLETLNLAIKNDGEFKDEALNDPAFRDYWNDPSFKDLAEA